MDLTETYFKMSKHELIQNQWKPAYGDWVAIWANDKRTGKVYLERTTIIMPRYPELWITLEGKEITKSDCIWLPYQHQIQKILNVEGDIQKGHQFLNRVKVKPYFWIEEASWEKYWLLAYMLEKYNKVWDEIEEEWVNK